MDKVFHAPGISDSDAKKFNICRMYLQVFYVSDIATGDGTSIKKLAWQGERDINKPDSTLWPKWGKPKPHYWKTWRKVLKLAFLRYGSKCLKQKVGTWLVDVKKTWVWYLSIDVQDKWLYRKSGESWIRYRPLGRNTCHKRFQRHGHLLQSPPSVSQLVPTTTYISGQYIHSEGITQVELEPPIIRASIQHPLHRLDPSLYKWLFFSITQSDRIDKILQDIQTGRCIAVSDGSFDPSSNHSTAGWVIESLDGTQYITGFSIVPTNSHTLGAYRSELCGILAICHMIIHLGHKFSIEQGKVFLGCDGLAALKTAMLSDIHSRSCTEKHSDLLSAISGLLAATPIKFSPFHIVGHQDSIYAFESLDRYSQMNVRMDHLAKAALIQLRNNTIQPPEYIQHPFSFPHIQVNGEKLLDNIFSTLYKKLVDEDITAYWINNKQRFAEEQENNIGWNANTLAHSYMTPARKRFVSKWSCENLGTGKNLKRWKYQLHDNCPFCNAEKEDINHILLCDHEESIQQWTVHHNKFQATLSQLDTSPLLVLAIAQDLSAWRTASPLPCLQSYPQPLQAAILEQRQIGWKHFMEGLISQQLLEYQHSFFHLSENKKYKLAMHKWTAKVIQAIWEFTFSIWETRNKKLHDTHSSELLKGRKVLEAAVRREWNIGLSILPASEYSSLFRKNLNSLLHGSLPQLKRWFSIIQNARILFKDPRQISDAFSTNFVLQEWAGIIDSNAMPKNPSTTH